MPLTRSALDAERTKLGEAINAAREVAQAYKDIPDEARPGEAKEKFDRAMADVETLSAKIERMESDVAKLEALDKRAEEFARHPVGPAPRREPPHGDAPSEVKAAKEIHARAFLHMVRRGDGPELREILEPLPIPERHALLGSQGDLGGFLVPEDLTMQVVTRLAKQATMWPLVSVFATGSRELVIPIAAAATGAAADIYPTGYAGSWRNEGYLTGGTAPTVQNQPTFEQRRIPVNSWIPDAVEITVALLEDNKADLMGILAQVITDTLALDIDAAVVTGNGVGRPRGITSFTPAITTVNSGAATALTYNGLVDLRYGLPSQYMPNARLLMRASTYGAMLKLTDDVARPLITPNTTPGTVLEAPYTLNENVAAVGAAAIAIIYGDFRRGYAIADRQELRVQRLVERYAPNVGILPSARIGGDVLIPEAFRTQTISA